MINEFRQQEDAPKKYNGPQLRAENFDEIRRQYPIRDLIVESLAADINVPSDENPASISPDKRTQEEQQAAKYLIDVLEAAMVAVCERLQFEKFDIPRLRLGNEGKGALYNVEDKLITLDRFVADEFFINYALFLKAGQWLNDERFSLDINVFIKKAAKALVMLINQIVHEMGHAYDTIHKPDQAIQSAAASASISENIFKYMTDQGEIDAQVLSLDVLKDLIRILDGENELLSGVADVLQGHLEDLQHTIKQSKRMQRMLQDDYPEDQPADVQDDMEFLNGTQEIADN